MSTLSSLASSLQSTPSDDPDEIRLASWHDAWLKRTRAGVPSRFGIVHFEQVAKPGLPVVVAARVSYCTQNHEGNLARWEVALRRAAVGRGCTVVGAVQHIGSGTDPWWILPAVRLAKQHEDAIVLAGCVDRFVRHDLFHSKLCAACQANDERLDRLRDVADGVPLVTLAHPDLDGRESRAFQTRLLREVSGRRGGRPVEKGGKKKRRAEQMPVVLRLHREKMSLRDIEKITGVGRATSARWIARFVDQNGTPEEE